jgi:hypothetical protein
MLYVESDAAAAAALRLTAEQITWLVGARVQVSFLHTAMGYHSRWIRCLL